MLLIHWKPMRMILKECSQKIDSYGMPSSLGTLTKYKGGRDYSKLTYPFSGINKAFGHQCSIEDDVLFSEIN